MKYVIYCYTTKPKINEEDETKWNTEFVTVIAIAMNEQAAIKICKALNNEYRAYYYYQEEE